MFRACDSYVVIVIKIVGIVYDNTHTVNSVTTKIDHVTSRFEDELRKLCSTDGNY